MTPVLTGRWRDVYDAARTGVPLDYTPTRISLGIPRYMPEGRAFPAIRELMPRGHLFRLEGDEFDAAFRIHLDGVGVETIRTRFAEVYAADPRPLLLLCFERVQAGERCHRRTLADWWSSRPASASPRPTCRSARRA